MAETPTFATLSVTTSGQVIRVALDRPDRMNVMNLQMRSELKECFAWIKSTDAVVVILTGAGEHFCAGGDANDFREASGEDLHALMADRSHEWFRELWTLPQVTIAAVNGTAAGGGINLALGADIVIASAAARFGETFIRLGLVPDLGGGFLLPRIVGLQRAKYLALTGTLLDAHEAMRLGMVSEVVAPDELDARAWELGGELAAKPVHALRAIKSMFNESFERGMNETLTTELYMQSFIFGTDAFRTSLESFLGKNHSKENAS